MFQKKKKKLEHTKTKGSWESQNLCLRHQTLRLKKSEIQTPKGLVDNHEMEPFEADDIDTEDICTIREIIGKSGEIWRANYTLVHTQHKKIFFSVFCF